LEMKIVFMQNLRLIFSNINTSKQDFFTG